MWKGERWCTMTCLLEWFFSRKNDFSSVQKDFPKSEINERKNADTKLKLWQRIAIFFLKLIDETWIEFHKTELVTRVGLHKLKFVGWNFEGSRGKIYWAVNWRLFTFSFRVGFKFFEVQLNGNSVGSFVICRKLVVSASERFLAVVGCFAGVWKWILVTFDINDRNKNLVCRFIR